MQVMKFPENVARCPRVRKSPSDRTFPRWMISVSPRIEIGEDILGPPAQPIDARTGQSFCHAFWERPAQIGPIDLRLR
jgi:hypothetical protein